MPVAIGCDEANDQRLNDAAEFVECMDGPDGGLGLGCLVFDGDGDDDVDLTDAAAFQRAFTGPQAEIEGAWNLP